MRTTYWGDGLGAWKEAVLLTSWTLDTSRLISRLNSRFMDGIEVEAKQEGTASTSNRSARVGSTIIKI